MRFDPTFGEVMGKQQIFGTDQNIRAAKIMVVLSTLILGLALYLKFKG